jgi:adenine-specific DNA-methyltransferase
MISIFTKGRSEAECQLMSTLSKEKVTKSLLDTLAAGISGTTWTSSQKDLYEGDNRYIRVSGERKAIGNKCIDTFFEKLKSSQYRVGDLFHVNQGLHTGADKLSKKHIEKYQIDGELGEGIFVLNSSEIAALKLSKTEQRYLKPLYKNSDISKYSTKNYPDLWFIDLSYPRNKDLDLNTIPKLIRHLERFKCILENRVDSSLATAKKLNLWWVIGLRKQIKYDGPKIVNPQRSRWNTFGYNDSEWFAASDVFFITSNEKSSVKINLEFLLGYLNSKSVFAWLYFMGKRKGETLELTQKPVSEIPIPIFSKKAMEAIAKSAKQLLVNPSDQKAIDSIDNIIFDELNTSAKERETIIDFYESRVGTFGSTPSDLEAGEDPAA